VRRPLLLSFLVLASGTPLRAQWISAAEQRVREQALRDASTPAARYEALIRNASGWTVSAKGRPYLHAADSLYHALKHHHDKSTRDTVETGRAYLLYLMGYQAKYRRDLSTALALFRESVERYSAPGQEAWQPIIALDGMGATYRALGLPVHAMTTYRRELAAIGPPGGHMERWRSVALTDIAGCWADMGHLNSAQAVLDQCERISATKDPRTLMERARIRLLQRDTTGARAYVEQYRDQHLQYPRREHERAGEIYRQWERPRPGPGQCGQHHAERYPH